MLIAGVDHKQTPSQIQRPKWGGWAGRNGEWTDEPSVCLGVSLGASRCVSRMVTTKRPSKGGRR
jgi:hypothetical protein